MTHHDFLSILEKALLEDDRWAIRQLEQLNPKSKLRREACRHADNLIIAEKSGSKEIAMFSRASLIAVLEKVQAE